jgi:hypothetical protein
MERHPLALVVDVQPDGISCTTSVPSVDHRSDVATHAHADVQQSGLLQRLRAQIRIAEHRGRPVENAWSGQAINDPPPDFAGLAPSLGWYAEGPIEDPKEIGPALQRAIKGIKGSRPALVDTLTQFN